MSELQLGGSWAGGWDEPGVTMLVLIQSGITGSGLFVYNGTPALGNPPIFSVVAPGTTADPYGNTVQAIVNIGPLTGSHTGWDSNAIEYLADSTGTPRIVLDPVARVIEFLGTGGLGTFPLITIAPQSGSDDFGAGVFQAGVTVYSASGAAGDPAAYAQLTAGLLQFVNALTTSSGFIGLSPSITATLQLTSPKSSAGDTVTQLALIPSSVGTPTAAVNKIQAWQPGAEGTTVEGWNSLGTLAGYTVTAARYRLSATGDVEFDINVSSAGANAASTTFSNTLGAAYRPTGASKTYPLATNLAVASMTSMPRLGITTAGVVSIAQTASVTTAVVGGAFMPRD